MGLFVFVFLGIVIVIILLVCLIHFLPSYVPDNQKGSPYECGFDPLNSARVPFSFRFFLVAILFLLFDLEIALLFPLPSAITSVLDSVFVVVIGSCFVVILTLGLVYEWVNGGLEWAD
uniref:NADH-ubiquinone oxidoreductase chain 3 n=1 Tax=Neogymnocrinus richeri TaxID=710152 RepID=Q2QJE8_9ECHI|nr:NADH dehydrogenase subunit 3 [Neogymnocrinus richeri]AAY51818.1 NADH dehydrogenase subunit 3 [Neogymnocrinus richeri]